MSICAGLAQLNDEYERLFPGLRYIIFVAGRSRAELLPEFERIVDEGRQGKRTWQSELDRAIDDIWRIAGDRASKLQGKKG
jgi:2-oxo-4-hydroxy-4-carboxy--5-ureidoimidazoline (OHCU) decarboxylase